MKSKVTGLVDVTRTVRVDASQATGHGHSHYDISGVGADHPLPKHTAHKVAQTKSERHVQGNPHNPHSQPEGQRGETMNLKEVAPGKSSTQVVARDRQMPDKDITSKAQEVASELHTHGEGEGFPGSGTMGR